MDKNSVIGFTLIAAIFIGFSVYESGRARKQAEYLAQQDSIARANMPVEEMTLDLTQEGAVGAAEAAASGSSVQVYKDTLLNAAAVQEGSIVAIENSKIRVEFNTKGAQPYSVKVKDYYNYDSTDLYLFRPGQADYSLSIYAGEYIHTRNFNFQVAQLSDSCVVMRLPFSGGGYIEQRYSLSEDSYMMHNMLSFVGMEGVIPRNVNMYDLDFSVTIPRMEKGYKNELQYSKLDYYYEESPREVQRSVLEEFLRLALEWDLPAIIHIRDRDGAEDAYADAYDQLRDFAATGGRFVVHCFAGTPAWAEKFLALGGYCGVTGMVTFKRSAPGDSGRPAADRN